MYLTLLFKASYSAVLFALFGDLISGLPICMFYMWQSFARVLKSHYKLILHREQHSNHHTHTHSTFQRHLHIIVGVLVWGKYCTCNDCTVGLFMSSPSIFSLTRHSALTCWSKYQVQCKAPKRQARQDMGSVFSDFMGHVYSSMWRQAQKAKWKSPLWIQLKVTPDKTDKIHHWPCQFGSSCATPTCHQIERTWNKKESRMHKVSENWRSKHVE